MGLKPPEFMPEGPPLFTTDTDPLAYRPVPGITFHEKNDGIIYYYDQPLVYVAWFQDQRVVVTLTDEDHEGPVNAKGWKQSWAIPVKPTLLRRVCRSELPFRALYEPPGVQSWFIHEDWQKVGDGWTSTYRVYGGLVFPDDAKPVAGVYLDPKKKPKDAP